MKKRKKPAKIQLQGFVSKLLVGSTVAVYKNKDRSDGDFYIRLVNPKKKVTEFKLTEEAALALADLIQSDFFPEPKWVLATRSTTNETDTL